MVTCQGPEVINYFPEKAPFIQSEYSTSDPTCTQRISSVSLRSMPQHFDPIGHLGDMETLSPLQPTPESNPSTSLLRFQNALDQLLNGALAPPVPGETDLDRLHQQADVIQTSDVGTAARHLVTQALEAARIAARRHHASQIREILLTTAKKHGLDFSSTRTEPVSRHRSIAIDEDTLERVRTCLDAAPAKTLTRRELTNQLRLNDTQSKRLLRELANRGHIERQGNGRRCVYRWIGSG